MYEKNCQRLLDSDRAAADTEYPLTISHAGTMIELFQTYGAYAPVTYGEPPERAERKLICFDPKPDLGNANVGIT